MTPDRRLVQIAKIKDNTNKLIEHLERHASDLKGDGAQLRNSQRLAKASDLQKAAIIEIEKVERDLA